MEDPLMVVLRIVHIVAGMFWAGSALFLAFILVPRLQSLGPEIQRSVYGRLNARDGSRVERKFDPHHRRRDVDGAQAAMGDS